MDTPFIELVKDKKLDKDCVGIPQSSLGICSCCRNMHMHFLGSTQNTVGGVKKARYLRYDFALSFN